jgi:hypothetical protein
MKGNRSQTSRIPHLGGVVTVTALRNRDGGEREEAFSVSYHSPGGDLCWLSPRIPSQEGADTAAEVLASFTHSVLAR